jgi:predicted RNA-binding Zn-ribbon protein involved in translation (DUF1610 family)
MTSIIRATCSHCGHESRRSTNTRTLAKDVAALTWARCPECGDTGIVIAITDERSKLAKDAVTSSPSA